MHASRLATLVVLAPALALAQGVGALNAAKAAGEKVTAGTEARMRAADAQLAPDPTPEQPDLTPQPALVAADQTGGAPGVATAPETYTVKRGDTLWDLSARFLDNPWYWPKVWSYNPQIANPHWIYPGNVVRFYPATEGSPARIEVESEGAGAERPRELEGFSRADMNGARPGEEADDVTVAGPYRIGVVAPKGVYARHDSFVTQRELEESGTITAAFEEKLLLSIQDRAYARFTDPAKVMPGGTYLLYRTERPVRHPVTGEIFGFKSVIVGAARIVAIDDRVATIEISQAYEPIERGALVGPWTDAMLKQVRRRSNERRLSGVIIAAQQDLVSEIGEHHVVFVDKGRADGVEEGNTFTVTRSGDPYGGGMNVVPHDEGLPNEDVGTLMVVDAQQTASAALVVQSLRELYVGDRVEMRPGSAARAR